MSRLVAVLMLAATAFAAEHGSEGAGDNSAMWKWVNFAVLAGLIGYGIAKNAGPLLAIRGNEIRRAIDDARQTRAEAEQRAAAIESKISNLATELDRMRAAAKSEMASEASRIQEETQKMLARMQENAAHEIASISKHAEQELRQHAARLALELAEAKVRSRVTPVAQTALVQRFVADLKKPLN